MRIIGGDVCKSSIVCWELSEIPGDLRQYFKTNRRKKRDDNLTFHLNRDGEVDFIDFIQGADCLCMEPTGINYSFLWEKIARACNVPIRWIGHPEVKYLRKSKRLPDKNDQADALTLALYAIENWGKETAFLRFESGVVSQVNELYLDLKSLATHNVGAVNKCRHKLAKEFPEAAFIRSVPGADGLSPLFAWLAQRPRYTSRGRLKYDRLYAESIAPKYITISEFTRYLANQICDNHLWDYKMTQRLSGLVYNSPAFLNFNQTFDLYGFGLMARTILLIKCYPFGRFDSVGAFKRRLGFGQQENSSGDVTGFHSVGSSLAKTELYLWCVGAIGKKRLTSEVGLEVQQKFEHYKQQLSQQQPDQDSTGRFTDLVRSKTIAFMLRRLFRDLKRNCTN
ncbi:MAG: hypothetical protein WBA93_24960 [Microcoleaceae cyanobacterium]